MGLVTTVSLPDASEALEEIFMNCYGCESSATGACSTCGQFYCARHGGKEGWSQRAYCAACFDRRRPYIAIHGTLCALIGLLPIGLGFAGLGNHRTAEHVGASLLMLLLGLFTVGFGVWRICHSRSQFPPGIK